MSVKQIKCVHALYCDIITIKEYCCRLIFFKTKYSVILFCIQSINREPLAARWWHPDHGITSTISRMLTKQMRGMKIMPNGSRTYAECRHCAGIQLDLRHLFNCISAASTLFNIDLNWWLTPFILKKLKMWPGLCSMPSVPFDLSFFFQLFIICTCHTTIRTTTTGDIEVTLFFPSFNTATVTFLYLIC